MLHHVLARCLSLFVLATTVIACDGDTPGKTSTSSTGEPPSLTCDANAGIVDTSGNNCATLPNDYTPRDAASAKDTWPACVSDGNQYVPIGQTTLAAARVAAFHDIGQKLGFGGLNIPSSDDFKAARAIYTAADGIESRVLEIEDDHFPAAPKPCKDLTADEQAQYPFRCVGPIRIRPILDIAFEAGSRGEDPVINVARIEAALLWFFYMSTYAEAIRAAENPAAVDESWASYTGGEGRDKPLALAQYVAVRSNETHDRIWDGLLALRCWRDLDNPQGPAMDTVMQSRAVEQLDRALVRGIALILRQRLELSACEPAWISAEILGGILFREAQARDPAAADVFIEELSRRRAVLVNLEKLLGVTDTLFPCP